MSACPNGQRSAIPFDCALPRGHKHACSPEVTAYHRALASGRKAGASRATDAELMAMFCEDAVQALAGAVVPSLVWEGAQARGMTTNDLLRLATTDAFAVHELMWDAQ